MDGSPRASVFAYKEELDRWLDRLLHEKEITSRKSFFLSNKKFASVLSISILFISILALVTWKILSPERDVPSSFDKPYLAILHFSNNTGDESLDHWRSVLPEWLITDLNQSKYLRVLRGDRLLNILRELNLIEAKSYDSKDLENVAQEGAVNHILKASFSKAGETFRIDYSLQDVNSWESVGSDYVTGKGEESFPSMVDELTKKIKADFNISADKIADDYDKDVGIITTSSPEAYKSYREGSNYHRMTEFRKAIESWEKAVAIDPGFLANDYVRSIAVDLEGNYVVAGVDELIDPYGGWRVQKIDQSGNNIWSYSSNPGPRWDWTSSVAVDKEGNYIIGGVVRFTGNYGWRAEKLNPSGSLLWSYTSNPTSIDDYIEAVAVDSYGNYILAGFELSVRESNERIRVEKLSSTGSLLWSYVHNPTTGYDRANSVAVDGKGNYIVAGYDEPGDANNFRWRVEKLDPYGNLIWEYISDPSDDSSYGHDWREAVASIAVDDDGNYVIAGYDCTPGNYQWRVEKIDADGNLRWVYTSNPSEQNETPRAIAVDKDGSYVVAGYDRALGDPRWRIEIINKDGNLVGVYTTNPSDENVFKVIPLIK